MRHMAGQKRPKNEKKHATGMMTVGGAAALLCLVLMFGSLRLRDRVDEYDAVARSLQAQIEEQQEESRELERESEYIKTEEYIEQIARDKLGLVKPNEIIFQKEEH